MIEELCWGFENVLPKKKTVLNPKPAVPDLGWKRPTGFPCLKHAKRLSVDLETYDPDLKTMGPGWARGVGHIVGMSISSDTGYSAYYPMRHREEARDNFNPDEVLAWLREQLAGPALKIAHNAFYDAGFLLHEGVRVGGRWWDTQTAERLISFHEEHSLEATARRRLGEGKESTELYMWLWSYFGRGNNPGPKQLRSMIAHIRDAPPGLCGPYAQSDTDLPLRIQEVQAGILEKEGLMRAFDLEMRLLPLLLDMRMAGVSVDIPAAEKADVQMTADMVVLQKEVNHIAGTTLELDCEEGEDFEELNTGSAAAVGKVFDALGIKYPRTEKTGKPSIKAEWLKNVEHPIAAKIVELQGLKKFRGTFVRNYILNAHRNGKIHGVFDPMGAVTGRFSAYSPNLENLPSRNHLAMMVRSIFIPDPGHAKWVKFDYSSIESRIFAHYARGKGSEELRAEYNANPDTDYHRYNQEMVKKVTGIELDRKYVKNLGFAKQYGASKGKLAKMLGLTQEEAQPVFEAFAAGLPYVDETIDWFSRLVHQQGETRTVMGRRVEFGLWEPMDSYGNNPLPFEKALSVWGTRIKRAYSYKAINFSIQGDASELLKTFLVNAYESGVFSVTGFPRLLVHDECDWSSPDWNDDSHDAFRYTRDLMENAIKFAVPLRAAGEIGKNWGELEEWA